MKQQEHESPAAFSQRVITKAKSVPNEYASITTDSVLTAVIYIGLLPHYDEPKAFLLNRESSSSASTFPTIPGDLVNYASSWVSSSPHSKSGPVRTLAMTQFDKIEKKTDPPNTASPSSKVPKTITKKDKEAALAAIDNIVSIPTSPPAPSKPCNCGGLHWRYLCPLLTWCP